MKILSLKRNLFSRTKIVSNKFEATSKRKSRLAYENFKEKTLKMLISNENTNKHAFTSHTNKSQEKKISDANGAKTNISLNLYCQKTNRAHMHHIFIMYTSQSIFKTKKKKKQFLF